MLKNFFVAGLAAVSLLMAPWVQAKTTPEGQKTSMAKESSPFVTAIDQLEQNLIRSTPGNAKPMYMAKGKGGWSSTGGGSGVSCGGSRLQLLDYFELERQYWVLPYHGEGVGAYLARIIDEKMAQVNPFFASQLVIALNKINFNNWTAVSNLEFIDDRGPLARPIPAGCSPIQVAAREKLSANDVHIYFDPNLIHLIYQSNPPRIGTLNVAILILHEALYLMGVEMNHRTSAPSRRVLGALLSDELYNGPGFRTGAFERMLQQQEFMDFVGLFQPKGTAGGVNVAGGNSFPSKASRRQSNEELRKASAEYGLGKDLKDKYPWHRFGQGATSFDDYLMNRASPEQAFIFLTMSPLYLPDTVKPHAYGYLLIDGMDDSQQIRDYCSELRLAWKYEESLNSTRPESSHVRKMKILGKSIEYCALNSY